MTPRQLAISGALAGGLVIFALFSAGLVHADVYQTDFGTEDNTEGNSWVLQIGTGYSGTASALSFFAGASLPSPLSGPIMDVEQYSDGTYGTLIGTCSFDQTTAAGTYATSTFEVARNPSGDSGLGCNIQPTSYVALFFQSDATGGQYFRFYGSASQAPPVVNVVSTPGGAVVTPYLYLSGVYGANSIDWTQITPAIPFTLGTSSTAIAASSSLWGALSTSTISTCNSGDPVADAICAAGAFLLLPSPSVFEQFAELPTAEQAHWPFSWLYQVQTIVTGQTATTGNMPAYSMDLFSAASTTFNSASTSMPDFLPSFTFFSSSTVMTYLPQTDWTALQTLLVAVLVLGLVADVFFTLRNRFHRV